MFDNLFTGNNNGNTQPQTPVVGQPQTTGGNGLFGNLYSSASAQQVNPFSHLDQTLNNQAQPHAIQQPSTAVGKSNNQNFLQQAGSFLSNLFGGAVKTAGNVANSIQNNPTVQNVEKNAGNAFNTGVSDFYHTVLSGQSGSAINAVTNFPISVPGVNSKPFSLNDTKNVIDQVFRSMDLGKAQQSIYNSEKNTLSGNASMGDNIVTDITKPLAWVQKNIFEPMFNPINAPEKSLAGLYGTEWRGIQKGFISQYLGSSQKVMDTFNKPLDNPVNVYGKVSHSVGELVGSVGAFVAGGEVLKAAGLGKLAMPVLFATLGQTSSPSTTTALQRIEKAPVDAIAGWLFGGVGVANDLKGTVQAVSKAAGIGGAQQFINSVIQGQKGTDALKTAGTMAAIAGLFHIAATTTGLISGKLFDSQLKQGVIEMSPQEVQHQVMNTDLKGTPAGNELMKASLDAQAQGKNIRVNMTATQKAPLANALNLKTPSGISFTAELVDAPAQVSNGQQSQAPQQPALEGQVVNGSAPTENTTAQTGETNVKTGDNIPANDAVITDQTTTLPHQNGTNSGVFVPESGGGVGVEQSGRVSGNNERQVPSSVIVRTNDSQLTPMDKIISTKVEPQKSLDNAKGYIEKAGRGEGTPRAPITVETQPDGMKKIIDGNATYQVLKEQGYTHIPTVENQASGLPLRTTSTGGNLTPLEDTAVTTPSRDATVTTFPSNKYRFGITKADDVLRDPGFISKYNSTIGDKKNLQSILKEVAPNRETNVDIKNINTAANKIASKLKRHPEYTENSVSDFLRSRIIANDIPDKKVLLDKLQKTADVVEVTNHTKDNNAWGYEGINATIKTKNGNLAEIQIHTPEEIYVDQKLHSFYEEWRRKEDIPAWVFDKSQELAAQAREEFQAKTTQEKLPTVVEESANLIRDALYSGDQAAAQALYHSFSDIKGIPSFESLQKEMAKIASDSEKEAAQIKNEIEQLGITNNPDDPTHQMMEIARMLQDHFSRPGAKYKITGTERTYTSADGQTMLVGGNGSQAFDKLIHATDITGFSKNIKILAEKFDKNFTQIYDTIRTGGIDGADYEQFRQYFDSIQGKRLKLSGNGQAVQNSGSKASLQSSLTPTSGNTVQNGAESGQPQTSQTLNQANRSNEVTNSTQSAAEPSQSENGSTGNTQSSGLQRTGEQQREQTDRAAGNGNSVKNREYNHTTNNLIESYASGERDIKKLETLLSTIDAQENPKKFQEISKEIAATERGNKSVIDQLVEHHNISAYEVLDALSTYIDAGARRGGRTISDFYKFLPEDKINTGQKKDITQFKTAEEYANAQINAYHGTPNGQFNTFNPELRGTGADAKLGYGDYGNGFYFTTSKGAAQRYAENIAKDQGKSNPAVIEAHIDYNNPFDMRKLSALQKEQVVLNREYGGAMKVPDSQMQKAIDNAGFKNEAEFNFYHDLEEQITDNHGDFNIAGQLKARGYDSIIAPNGEITVFDKSQIKTKQQLIQEYKNANHGAGLSDTKQPWQMTKSEWNNEFSKTQVNFSGTGGQGVGMGRGTTKGFNSGLERQDFLKMGLKDRNIDGMQLPARHAQVIQEAVRQGLPVPQHILNEYSDIGEPQGKESVSTSVQLNAGIDPGLKQFFEGEIEPAYQAVREVGREWNERINPPRASEKANKAANSIREAKAKIANYRSVVHSQLDPMRRLFNKYSDAQNIKNISHYEQTGQWSVEPRSAKPFKVTNPESNKVTTYSSFNEFYREANNAAYQVLSAAYGKTPESYVENYVRRMFVFGSKTDEAKGTAFLSNFMRSLSGSKSPLKHRVLDMPLNEALANMHERKIKVKPATTNPIDLLEWNMVNAQRALSYKQAWNESKNSKLIAFVPRGSQVPDGFVRLEDRAAEVFAPAELHFPDGQNENGLTFQDKGYQSTVAMGRYYADSNVARVFNNAISSGLEGSATFRGIRFISNSMNQFQLGLSGFHFTAVSIDAGVTDISIGLRYMLSGKPIKSMQHIGVGVVPFASFAKDLYRGHSLLEGLKDNSPQAYEFLQSRLNPAGGRLGQDARYRNESWSKITHALTNNNPLGVMVRTAFYLPPALVEMVSHPLINFAIPRVKLGAFMDLAELRLSQLPKDAGDFQRKQALVSAWTSIDNRMGQLVYDNLFWNKAGKDVAMLTTRSVGWNLGTVRELGGAVVDSAGTIRGKGISDRMLWGASLVMYVALLSAIYMYLHTGQLPKELKDYFHPKNGLTDKNGNPDRVNFPSYMKDVFAYLKDPLGTVMNKTSPFLETISALKDNKDYYGNLVRNPNDPAGTQLAQLGEYILQNIMPFSIQQFINQLKLGANPEQLVESFLGIIKAPQSVIQSQAQQNLIKAYQSQVGLPAPKTPEQVQIQNLKNQARDEIKKNGWQNSPTFKLLMQNGTLKTQLQRHDFIKSAGKTTMQRMVQHMPKNTRRQFNNATQ